MQSRVENVLIASSVPYFLEKGNFWFKENLEKILEARKSQAFFDDNILFVEKNQSYNLSHFLRKLDEMGYEKVLTIENPGEFSQKGGLVDVFPINENNGFRFEFFGNSIEEIFELDIKTENSQRSKEILIKRLKSQRIFSDLKGLKQGNYLVHLDHGIGRFAGFFSQISNAKEKQGLNNTEPGKYYVIEYAAGDKLYVPIGLERKLSRYVGFLEPSLSRLSSPFWERTKRKIKEGAEQFAKELFSLYGKRTAAQRQPYLRQEEFDYLASNFPHQETLDQKETFADVEKDFSSTKPMDRLICGDVGFGKTEVALRTMARVVFAGEKAVMLCPTAILAQFHFLNFRERLKELPIRIYLLSRLESKKAQSQTVRKIKEGKFDIIIGTHRILSKDVSPMLFGESQRGLLVIDDEQRFGVKQKEQLKGIRNSIDVLSLSATPIPRTLHFALSSLKDVSFIQTPPPARLPIKTFIAPYKKSIIKKAIAKELGRKGQIYFLHNRIKTIDSVKAELQELAPKAKIGIAHGRMREKDLILVMKKFQEKELDILLATTIIENGLDLPNVNTIIVSDSSKLGLSQAYQIRGRVGRTHIKAFAYFLYRSRLSAKAKDRLSALKEAEELGAGYRIALKDLEIRGAGNILGKEQSGNINRVGLNLYCQMIAEAVEKLKQDF